MAIQGVRFQVSSYSKFERWLAKRYENRENLPRLQITTYAKSIFNKIGEIIFKFYHSYIRIDGFINMKMKRAKSLRSDPSGLAQYYFLNFRAEN
jgi:hypothetical protein